MINITYKKNIYINPDLHMCFKSVTHKVWKPLAQHDSQTSSTFSRKSAVACNILLLVHVNLITVKIALFFCLLVRQECWYKNGGCWQYCTDTPRALSVTCSCANGYTLEDDGKKCAPAGKLDRCLSCATINVTQLPLPLFLYIDTIIILIRLNG